MDFQDYNMFEARLMVETNIFHSKMTYDFTRIVFLGLRKETTTKNLGEVVRMASTRHGFLGYKTFSYKGEKTTHLYIKFENGACAEKAIVFFRSIDRMYNADLVNNIILTWYFIEKNLEGGAEPTNTIVDIEPHPDSPICHRNIELQSAMGLFGHTHIVNTSTTSAQVSFPSFALALAAAIALGRWCLREGVEKEFGRLYTVKIVPGDKEARLFTISGSPPDEAFQMEYFIQPAASSGNETGSKSSEFKEGHESKTKIPMKTFADSFSEWKYKGKLHANYKNVCESKTEFVCIEGCKTTTSKHLDMVTQL